MYEDYKLKTQTPSFDFVAVFACSVIGDVVVY